MVLIMMACKRWRHSPFLPAFRCNFASDRNASRCYQTGVSAKQEQGNAQEQEQEQVSSIALNNSAISSGEEKSTEEGYDFRTLPELTSSFYENYELPSSMLRRQKRPILLKSLSLASNSLFHSKPCIESIPPCKGAPYDFGLKTIMPTSPPPLEARGGFDINLSFDNLDEEDSSKGESRSSSLGCIDFASMSSREGYDSKTFPKLTASLYANR